MEPVEVITSSKIYTLTETYRLLDEYTTIYYERHKNPVILSTSYAKEKLRNVPDMMMVKKTIIKTSVEKITYMKIYHSRGLLKTNLDSCVTYRPPISLEPRLLIEELPLIEELEEKLNC